MKTTINKTKGKTTLVSMFFPLASIFLAGSCLFTSCNDFLETEPGTGYTVEEVFSSDAQAKMLLKQLYSQLTTDGRYGSTLIYGLNTNTDVEMSSFSSEIADSRGSDVGCFDAKPTWTTLNNVWNDLYSTINNANDFIQNIEASGLYRQTDADSLAEARQMDGEAKCIRAMVYLDLIRTWGDVVFVTKPSTAQDDFFHTGTTDRNKILDYLINELKEAEPNMKWAADLHEGVERCSREYCQALIGQLCLYRGGYALYPQEGTKGVMKRQDDYLTYYNTAVEYLGKLVNSGKHSLRQSFAQEWYDVCNKRVTNDDDPIFEVPMVRDVTSRLGYNDGVTIASGSHEYGSARNYCTFSGIYPFTFDKRDLRCDETCTFYAYDKNLDQTISKTIGFVGYGSGKWSKLKMENPMGSNSGSNTGIDNIKMRYADVLLMYAEALNEVNNGPTGDAKAALKEVRRRAFKAGDQTEMVDAYVDALNTKDQFFKAIMNERKWEFGGEGVRKYDLARWNKYSEVIKNLYQTEKNWALSANGQYVAGLDSVPANIYYHLVTDSTTGHKVLEFRGINEYGDGVNQPRGWSTQAFASGWYVLNRETENYDFSDEIYYSFRGYIGKGNEKPTGDLRYLLPYPSKVITDHRGYITQQYGY